MDIRNYFSKINSKDDNTKEISLKSVIDEVTAPSKFLSWNVNGIRSCIVDNNTSKYKSPRKLTNDSPLGKIIEKDNPDVICFQETRLGHDNISLFEHNSFSDIYPYQYWSSSKGTGGRSSNRYSGTSVWSKYKPINVEYDLDGLGDREGRVIKVTFSNCIVINTYTPNSGSNFDYRINHWEPILKENLKKLNNLDIPVIYCGDFNIANKKDVWFGDALEAAYEKTTDVATKTTILKKIKSKTKLHTGEIFTPSYSKQERDAYNSLLIETHFIDCFRHLKPNIFNEFTWFNIRDKTSFKHNRGWLIDRFIVNSRYSKKINNCKILRKIGIRNKDGNLISDHLPIFLDIDLK